MEAELTHETLSKLLSTKFQIPVDAANPVELELSEISELLESPRQERFAIVFRGPTETFLGQGMRRFEHPQLGQFNLFLVPISQDDQGYCYEVVFNRIVST